MKKWLIFWIAGLSLSACASAPDPNPWDEQVTETEPATRSVDCGRFPMPTEVREENGQIVAITYNAEKTNDLERYRQCMGDNAGIADDNALTIDELKIVRKALVRAGAAQYNIAEMRETMLEDERKHHLWKSLGYWVLILGAVAL